MGLFAEGGIAADRKVIDVSGDGTSNQGRAGRGGARCGGQGRRGRQRSVDLQSPRRRFRRLSGAPHQSARRTGAILPRQRHRRPGRVRAADRRFRQVRRRDDPQADRRDRVERIGVALARGQVVSPPSPALRWFDWRAARGAGTMTKADLSDLYRRYIACLNRRDWPRLGQFVGESVAITACGSASPAIARCSSASRRSLTSHSTSPVDRRSAACREPPRVRLRAKGKVPRSRRRRAPRRLHGKRFYEIREGKIDAVWSIVDKAAIEAQL